MKNSRRIISLPALVLLVIICTGACSPLPEATTAPIIPSSTATLTSTGTITPSPTSTDTPTPTPLPGVLVVPLSSLEYGNPWLPVDRSKALMSSYYGFNFNKIPFGNVLVRQAFAAAIDREQIAEEAASFHFRNVIPATTLTPSEVLGRDLYGVVGIPFNPTRAKEYLVEAGFTSLEFFPVVTLVVYMRGEAAPGAYYHMAEFVAEMWETHIGVTVEVKVLSKPQDYIALFEQDPPEIFQLVWGADYCDPDNFLNTLLHSTSVLNYGHFSDAEYDRLVERAAGRADPAERQQLYIQAEQILTEQFNRDHSPVLLFLLHSVVVHY